MLLVAPHPSFGAGFRWTQPHADPSVRASIERQRCVGTRVVMRLWRGHDDVAYSCCASPVRAPCKQNVDRSKEYVAVETERRRREGDPEASAPREKGSRDGRSTRRSRKNTHSEAILTPRMSFVQTSADGADRTQAPPRPPTPSAASDGKAQGPHRGLQDGTFATVAIELRGDHHDEVG